MWVGHFGGRCLTSDRWAGRTHTLKRSGRKQQSVAWWKGEDFTTIGTADIYIYIYTKKKHQAWCKHSDFLTLMTCCFNLLIVEMNIIQKPANMGSWYPILKGYTTKNKLRYYICKGLYNIMALSPPKNLGKKSRFSWTVFVISCRFGAKTTHNLEEFNRFIVKKRHVQIKTDRKGNKKCKYIF